MMPMTKPSQLILFFISLNELVPTQPSSCLLRCKDNYVNEMQKILDDTEEWTMELSSPLHSLIKGLSETFNNQAVIYQRLQNACKTNNEYIQCLFECRERKISNILLKGQTSWMNICDAFARNTDEFLTSVLPCWARHGAAVGRFCAPQRAIIQNAMVDLIKRAARNLHYHIADICKSATMYDKCLAWQADAFCGEKAWKFVLYINRKTSLTIVELLQESKLIVNLPKECEQWIAPSKYMKPIDHAITHRRDVAALAVSNGTVVHLIIFALALISLL
ncbi:unnamed protein product [Dracunculus medinensis]|uniref:CPG4 domain-containing protein n=1 Tax=Dracunculus medinensis TaxID=318479 RepID=A0A0N4UGD7_DRAME|nr:unnamed protein product [Dracunculus medinensis]